jgi:hypothetical protein
MSALTVAQQLPLRDSLMTSAPPESYVAADDLAMAVNAEITLERPLLVKDEAAAARPNLRGRWRRCRV